MNGLGDLAGKAKNAAKEHPDQVDKAADRAKGLAEDHTGHKHDEQIDRSVDAARKSYGGGDADPDANS